MIEKHPFGNFIPQNTQYLILGSFTGKITDDSYDWFYSNKRNLFWPIIQEVYGTRLQNKKEKQELFTHLGIAMADIILSCERKSNSNLDMNLTNIVLNKKVEDIFDNNKIKKIFFSSRFVEKLFKRHFKGLILKYSDVELTTLPSPSPRYAAMSKSEKVARYKKLLPRL
jgi:hypoxanthine-DNA glycosylase